MAEDALRIRIFGDPVLRRKARVVGKIKQYHRDLLDKMVILMHASSGIGLAAPQVGIGEALIVVDIGTGIYKLINPRIVKKEGNQVMEEGCLSVPGICIKVRRSGHIQLEALDEYSKPVKIEASELLSCVLQHEIEHLKGKLIVDHASLFDKIRIKKRLAELKKMARDEEMSNSEKRACRLQL